MSAFEHRLREYVTRLRRDPDDAEARRAFEQWFDAHRAEFRALLPPDVLSFGIAPSKVERRLQFLKNLLLQGYMPPRVEPAAKGNWDRETVNVAVVTSYFYSNALSLLEAGVERSDVAVFVAPPSGPDEPWIETCSVDDGVCVQLRAALMLDRNGLVWRRFATPVPVHYLFPVDNYYRSKFQLVNEYASCGVPMAGSALIREACEDKLQLASIAGKIAGLRLARELVLRAEDDACTRAETIDRFCVEHHLATLVTKPADEFGGAGVAFWRYPEQRDIMLGHLDDNLRERRVMLMQERIFPVRTADGYEWNLRQYVLRNGPETIVAPWKRVRIGEGIINTTQGAGSITVEQLLAAMPFAGSERARFEAALARTDVLSPMVMRALDRYLRREYASRAVDYCGSGANVEADLLALDFMIAADPDAPDGYAIYLNEINDFASGGMRNYEILAHRQAFPAADSIRAVHPFSMAPHILEAAKWRGGAYKAAMRRA